MEVAEACKILENTYRAVNIALVNELKVLYDKLGIDVWEVIDAAKTKPFGFQAFYPGPGLGGHCIPIDPFYLTWLARKHGEQTRFIELAGEINTHMPQYVVTSTGRVSQRAAQADQRQPVSPARRGIQEGHRRSSREPVIRADEAAWRARRCAHLQRSACADCCRRCGTIPICPHGSQPLTPAYLAAQDCVLIATDHSAYDYDFIVEHSRLVLDTRNATKQVTRGREKIRKA